MTKICKNCDQHLEGKFCIKCGQAADTHKINMHYIWHEIQHGIIHVDHGIFYTIGQLLTRPGYTIREFIDGKRVRHFKPVALVVVLTTIYGLLFHYFITDLFENETIHSQENVISVYGKLSRWITDHFAYCSLILIITTTIGSHLAFKKQAHNFAEHLVLNTYFWGLILIANIVLFPVLLKFSGTENAMNYVFVAQTITLVLMYWCYSQFFSRLSKIASLGRTLLTFFIMSNLNVGLAYLVTIILKLVS